jgi:hypothetical protein
MHFYTPDIFFFKIDYKKNIILKKKILSWYFFFFNWQKNTSKKFLKISKIYFIPQLLPILFFYFLLILRTLDQKKNIYQKKIITPEFTLLKILTPEL